MFNFCIFCFDCNQWLSRLKHLTLMWCRQIFRFHSNSRNEKYSRLFYSFTSHNVYFEYDSCNKAILICKAKLEETVLLDLDSQFLLCFEDSEKDR